MGGDHKYQLSPDEYVFGAISIYLDVINCERRGCLQRAQAAVTVHPRCVPRPWHLPAGRAALVSMGWKGLLPLTACMVQRNRDIAAWWPQHSTGPTRAQGARQPWLLPPNPPNNLPHSKRRSCQHKQCSATISSCCRTPQPMHMRYAPLLPSPRRSVPVHPADPQRKQPQLGAGTTTGRASSAHEGAGLWPACLPWLASQCRLSYSAPQFAEAMHTWVLCSGAAGCSAPTRCARVCNASQPRSRHSGAQHSGLAVRQGR